MESEIDAEISEMFNKKNEDRSTIKRNRRYRMTVVKSNIAQLLAGLACSFSTLTIGMMLTVPSVVIGQLHNSRKGLSLNDEQTSWMGSLLYLIQPASSVLGAALQPYVGRKYGLILTFVPQFVGWILLASAASVEMLYLSVVLFGISTGSIEAPGLGYLGEATDPHMRDVVTSVFNVAVGFGYLTEFLLASFFSWRKTAAISAIVPVVAIVSILFIPDSPLWLLCKGRKMDALKALCWLRGWVSPECVQREFDDMYLYVENSRNANRSTSNGSRATAKWKHLISILCSSSMWQPLLLISFCHFSYHSATVTGMRGYFLEIFRTLKVPGQPEFFAFINSVLMTFGGCICVLIVNFLGKRKLFLISLTINALLCMALGYYIFYNDSGNFVWMQTALLCILHLIYGVGSPIPWMLTSEVFPVSGRAMGAGLAAAAYYCLGFVFSKTYKNLEEIIRLEGCFFVYGIGGLIGFLYIYYFLPETKNKTLAEIEAYFSPGRSKKATPVAIV